MDARERIVKTINHEEPDQVPSFEDTIDNLDICEHYGEKYFLHGVEKINKIFYYLSFGSTKLMSKIMCKFADGNLAAKMLVKGVGALYRKIGIDLSHVVLSTFPIEFNKTGLVSECGHKFQYKKNPTDGMTMTYYIGGVLENFEDYENFPKPDPDRPVRERVFRAAKQFDAEQKGNSITVPVDETTSQIEIVGTHVVPEFGTIAMIVLAVAIVSIIAVSAKSRLSIMPRI